MNFWYYNLRLRDEATWGYSSAGRALEWHSRGQRFDPAYLHQRKVPRFTILELFLFGIFY